MPTEYKFDPDESTKFLNTLAGFFREFKNGKFTFQTFDDDKDRKRPDLVRILHGTFEEHSQHLQNLNKYGAGVFVTINKTNLKGRSKENVIRLHALFVDLDGEPLPTSFPIDPFIVVESSPGRFHLYWALDQSEPVDEDRFRHAQRQLAAYYHGDPIINDLPRVMRLPGFVHQKAGDGRIAEPFQTRILKSDPDHLLRTIEEILAAHPVEVPQPVAAAGVPHQYADADDKLRTFEKWAAAVATDMRAPSGKEPGNRNATLFKIAAEARGRDISEDVALSICMGHAMGLDASEVGDAVTSAYSKPRDANELKHEPSECIYTPAPLTWSPPAAPQVELELDPVHDLDDLWNFKADDDPDALFKNRFLCKGDGALFVGESGKGKSSFIMQSLILWSLGRPMFGITPVRPLRSILIQSENNKGDLSEQYQGSIRGLNLEDKRKEIKQNLHICDEFELTSEAFIRKIERLALRFKPDLIAFDPLLAYIGGDLSKQENCSRFLRNQLNPVLKRNKCACMIIHHTNKPTPEGKVSDLYKAAGSADLINWARALLYLAEPNEGQFELKAPKRGRRAGLSGPNGELGTVALAHSSDHILWEYRTQSGAYISPSAPEKSDVKYERKLSVSECLDALTEEPIQQSCRDVTVKTWRTELKRLHPKMGWTKIDESLRIAVQDKERLKITLITPPHGKAINHYSVDVNGVIRPS